MSKTKNKYFGNFSNLNASKLIQIFLIVMFRFFFNANFKNIVEFIYCSTSKFRTRSLHPSRIKLLDHYAMTLVNVVKKETILPKI